jgi:hypothetical protein
MSKSGGSLSLRKLECKEKFDAFDVSFDKALELSKEFGVPLHPEYIYFWTQISMEEFYGLLTGLGMARLADGKLVLPWTREGKERFAKGKRALELIGCEHEVSTENVVLKH